MTWEEAYRISSATLRTSNSTSDVWVDWAVALGMLKLDEPKPKSRMSVFCKEMNWPEGGVSYQMLAGSLDKAGLKIVEK